MIPSFYFECAPPAPAENQQIKRLYLELTPLCNSRCPGCLNEAFIESFPTRQRKPQFHTPHLDFDGWQAALQCVPNTLQTVIFSGGEPTLHPQFLQIAQMVAQRGLTSVLFTNGRWIQPQTLITALNALPNFGGMLISLHGSDSRAHAAFDGISDSFEQVCANIQHATAAGISVALSCVLTRHNFTQIESMAELALRLGAGALSFNRYLYTPERALALRESVAPLAPPQLQQAIRRVEALRAEYAGRLEIGYGPTIPQCFEPNASQACGAGFNSAVLDPWGNLRPCLHTDLISGNVLHQDFESLWEGAALQGWRDLTSEACSGCSLAAQCGGGCRAMARAWGNHADPLYGRDPAFILAQDVSVNSR